MLVIFLLTMTDKEHYGKFEEKSGLILKSNTLQPLWILERSGIEFGKWNNGAIFEQYI